jgi:hypothetical protein
VEFWEWWVFPHVTYGDGRFLYVGSSGKILELDTRINLSANASPTNGLLSLTVMALPGIKCTIEASTNLLSWEIVTNFTTAQEITQINVGSSASEKTFYRGYSD